MTCPGHCCRCFYLPQGPEYIWERYQDYLRYGPDENNWPDGAVKVGDIELVAPMLVYLGHFSQTELDVYAEQQGLVVPPDDHKYAASGHYYTCRHHQADGKCAIYEQRPKMCREYPYEWMCRYPGCDHRPTKHAVPKELPRWKSLESEERGDA